MQSGLFLVTGPDHSPATCMQPIEPHTKPKPSLAGHTLLSMRDRGSGEHAYNELFSDKILSRPIRTRHVDHVTLRHCPRAS